MAVRSRFFNQNMTSGIFALVCLYITSTLTEGTFGKATHQSTNTALSPHSSQEELPPSRQTNSRFDSDKYSEQSLFVEEQHSLAQIVGLSYTEERRSNAASSSIPGTLPKLVKQRGLHPSSRSSHSRRRLLNQVSDEQSEGGSSSLIDAAPLIDRSAPHVRSAERRQDRKLVDDVVALGNNFTYHGGPLLTKSLRVYPHWYGDWSDEQKATITNFFYSLNHDNSTEESPSLASWYSIISQYKDIAGSTPSTNISVDPPYNDYYSLGKYLSDALDNGTTLFYSHYAHGLPINPNGLYLLLTSPEVEIIHNFDSESTNTCEFHCLYEHFTLPGDQVLTAMLAVNRAEACNTSPFNSTALPPSGDAGVDSMLAGLASCMATAILDPQTSGWNLGVRYTGLQGICPYDYYPNATIGDDGVLFNVYGHNGSRFLMNGLWDASSQSCALQYGGFTPTAAAATVTAASSSNVALLAVIGGGCAVLFLLSALLVFYCWFWRRDVGGKAMEENPTMEKAIKRNDTLSKFSRASAPDFSSFGGYATLVVGENGTGSFVDFADGNLVRYVSLEEVKAATDSFSLDLRLGKGGYGSVYKGTAPDGSLWAVKRAHLRHEDEIASTEFRNEVDLISRLRHKNLVALVAFCFEAGEQILIYEFVPNGTLRQALRPGPKSVPRPPLSFPQRVIMAIGSARALHHLHGFAGKNSIIHRDVKSDNILLDHKLEAKLADFGLTRPMDEGVTHISTRAGGTFGYMDPHHFTSTQVTTKSDVFSYGVVLLELVTGQPPILPASHEGGPPDLEEREGLVSYVMRLTREGRQSSILDPTFPAEFSLAVDKFMRIALQCVQGDNKLRPEMGEILVALDGVRAELSRTAMGATGIDDPQNFSQRALSSTRTSTDVISVSGESSRWVSPDFSGSLASFSCT
eukprot:TRINITY_DN360_c0_g1_i10.p1 TRINITY_DN360_c0_g1~~TRINITY_DN360_c0_g1_i10.p1  ORF type:complete len:915 (+),score=77.32 TRINITY_DN360_c0_g1_i10:1578-4322(+)